MTEYLFCLLKINTAYCQHHQGEPCPFRLNTQLMPPLLQTLKDKGGAARPRDLYDSIAEQFNCLRRTATAPQVSALAK